MATIIDTPNDTSLTIDASAPDARSQMLASASAIAATVIDVEGKLAETAKAWGHNLMRAVYVDNMNMDSMIGDSKLAAGFDVLNRTDAGKKAKARLEVYFSNARLVAEKWDGMDGTAKADILAGLSSIHYVAGQYRKAAADAKKAADKEAKRIAAEAEAEKAKAAANESAGQPVTEAAPVSMADMILALSAAIEGASLDDFAANAEDFSVLFAAFDAKVNAASDAGLLAKAA